jgi:hypothetical protein
MYVMIFGSVWRPLIDSVEDWPLAVCDGQTVNWSDLVETDHVRRQYSGSTLYLMRNSEQRFYYMSKQSKQEVLIFKNFDSEKGVGARCMCNPISLPSSMISLLFLLVQVLMIRFIWWLEIFETR